MAESTSQQVPPALVAAKFAGQHQKAGPKAATKKRTLENEVAASHHHSKMSEARRGRLEFLRDRVDILTFCAQFAHFCPAGRQLRALCHDSW